MRKRIWRVLPQVCSLLGRTPEFSAEKVCSLFVPVYWDSQLSFSLLEANKLGAVTSCYFSTLNGIRHLYVHIDCFHMFFVIKAILVSFFFFSFWKEGSHSQGWLWIDCESGGDLELLVLLSSLPVKVTDMNSYPWFSFSVHFQSGVLSLLLLYCRSCVYIPYISPGHHSTLTDGGQRMH